MPNVVRLGNLSDEDLHTHKNRGILATATSQFSSLTNGGTSHRGQPIACSKRAPEMNPSPIFKMPRTTQKNNQCFHVTKVTQLFRVLVLDVYLKDTSSSGFGL